MFSDAVLYVAPKFSPSSASLVDGLLDLFDEHNGGAQMHAVQLRVCVFLAAALASGALDAGDARVRATLKVLHDEILSHAHKFECLAPFVNATAHLLLPPNKPNKPPPPPPPAASPAAASATTSAAAAAAADFAANPKNQSLLRELSTVSAATAKTKTTSIFVRKSKKKSWCEQFLEIDSRAVAEQLTSLESSIFVAIESHDLLININASKRPIDMSSDTLSTVDISIGHFNFISAWVITRVLMGRKPKSRAKMLIKFVQIATHLLELKNYNTLMSVILGLTSTPIVRMKQTQNLFQMNGQFGEQQNWASKLYELEQLMSSEKLFEKYRAELKDAEGPCIPYLGLMFRDLIYIEEGNKDFFADGVVNVGKALMLGDVILTIQQFQSRPHEIPRDPYILSMILESTALSTEESYALSLELEPRQ